MSPYSHLHCESMCNISFRILAWPSPIYSLLAAVVVFLSILLSIVWLSSSPIEGRHQVLLMRAMWYWSAFRRTLGVSGSSTRTFDSDVASYGLMTHLNESSWWEPQALWSIKNEKEKARREQFPPSLPGPPLRISDRWKGRNFPSAFQTCW